MDLTGWLLRAAARRPSVLLLELPGGTGTRLLAERVLRERGWPVVHSPAAASVLLLAGPDTPDLADAAELIWEAIPAPRTRIATAALDPDVLSGALDRGAVELRGRPLPGPARVTLPMAAPVMEQEMDMPGGLPMAEPAPDRDGLKLDTWTVTLGPLLADWPVGLSARLRLQGDVVQDVEFAVAQGLSGLSLWAEPATPRHRCAQRLDNLGRFLAVAGWPDAAARARQIRDRTLTGAGAGVLAAATAVLRRRVTRSRTLRWLTDGLGVTTDGCDVTARWQAWLEQADTFARAADELTPVAQSDRMPALDLLPELLIGSEWAGVRLIVASVDLDLIGSPARNHG